MRIRITNFNRFMRSTILIAMTIILLILLSNNAFSHEETKYKTIYVSSGDTIWSIAKDEIKENDFFKNNTTREVVYQIQNINQLSSSNIYIGQELIIPIN